MGARFIVGDSLRVLRSLPDASADLVLTSPPFLALRSYLPADHPDKAAEIGSEATPGEFIDVLLDIVEECRRVLAPHGSLCFELGDTYAGSGGAGGDYGADGLRAGQPTFRQQRVTPDLRRNGAAASYGQNGEAVRVSGGDGWPLDKSLTLIPELLRLSLAYGFNPLTGRQTPRWRVRNVVRWCLDGDTVVYAKTPKGVGPTRLLHLAQNFQPGQWELWDGSRWAPVLGWSSTTADDAIEIEFRNGERISATREHEWPTSRGLMATADLTIGDVVDTARLPDSEIPPPAHLPDVDIGWLVGTFLADGSFDSRDRIQVSGHRDEMALRLARLSALATAYDGTCSAHEIGDGNESVVVLRSFVLAAVIRRYVGGDGARNKCLRAAAWRRNNTFLSAVLDAYLDGDGWWDGKNERWRLGFTDNPWLARDIRTLCARLGYSCRIRRRPKAADPRGGQFAGTASHYHRGEIRLRPGPRVLPDAEIVALRPSKRRRFYDIGVEGEPHLFALASGILTHNCRPNPPVGALADKVRPATSDIVVACTSRKRYFDLDAVRSPHVPTNGTGNSGIGAVDGGSRMDRRFPGRVENPSGAPPLDHWWFDDVFDQDAWRISTEPYRGSHYATWPRDLCVLPIESMCPRRVCRTCGEPSRRITGPPEYVPSATYRGGSLVADAERVAEGVNQWVGPNGAKASLVRQTETTGWSDCGHNDWRPGLVLDPFAGSGTTLAVATGQGRDAIGIDLDDRNAHLARQRVGMFLDDLEHFTDSPRVPAAGACEAAPKALP